MTCLAWAASQEAACLSSWLGKPFFLIPSGCCLSLSSQVLGVEAASCPRSREAIGTQDAIWRVWGGFRKSRWRSENWSSF